MSKILVVEDDVDTSRLLTRWLRRDRHEVVIEGSGEGALRRLGEGSYDLLLLDIHLPGIDGYKVARRARALQTPPSVLALTIDDREQVPGDMKIPLLEKPYTHAALRSAINQVLTAEHG